MPEARQNERRTAPTPTEQSAYEVLCREQLLPAEPDFSEAIAARVAMRSRAFERLAAAVPVAGRLRAEAAALTQAEAVRSCNSGRAQRW